MGITREQFDEIRSYADYAAYAVDQLPMMVTVPAVSDAELAASVRTELTAEESDAFTDERLIAFSKEHRGGTQRACVKGTAEHTRDRLAQRVAGQPAYDDVEGLATWQAEREAEVVRVQVERDAEQAAKQDAAGTEPEDR